MRIWVLLPFLACLLAVSCSSKSPSEKEATAIINSKCRQCHTTGRVYDNKGRDKEWWLRTIERMQNYGAKINDEEIQKIVSYLSSS